MLRQPSTWPYTAHTHSLTLADRPPARERALPPILTLVHAHSRSGENLSYGSSSGGEDGKVYVFQKAPLSGAAISQTSLLPRFPSHHRACPASTRHAFVEHCRGGLLRALCRRPGPKHGTELDW